VRELITGELDLILIALPIEEPEVETLHLFDDGFILATKATKRNQRLRHANADMLADNRLLLLEEGHCLRDQALSYCHMLTPEARNSFGASSLATIVQMVANGYGITLLPEMAIASEVHASGGIRLLRFNAPEPKREIGLVWRKTSPRKKDFIQLAALLREVAPRAGKHAPKRRGAR
jgi:LysR family hydrogen peroxide-inducible transcriptional activator